MSSPRFTRVAVIGAGTMGRGIAHVAAASGATVQLVDADKTVAEAAKEMVDGSLGRAVAKGKITEAAQTLTLERIVPTDDRAAAIASAEVVVEAVPEKMELKRELFAEFGRDAPADALLGSNTSSLSITAMAKDSGAAERVVGLHFFNPVHVMALLEIIRGDETSDESVEAARAFAAQLGKEPILVKDVPGFATSRLGVLLGLEGVRMVEEGVASAEDIDKALELGYRHPMGPLKLTDLVGLDVRLAIAEHLHRELQSPRFEPPQLLRDMVAAGKLGKKSGEGFYRYAD